MTPPVIVICITIVNDYICLWIRALRCSLLSILYMSFHLPLQLYVMSSVIAYVFFFRNIIGLYFILIMVWVYSELLLLNDAIDGFNSRSAFVSIENRMVSLSYIVFSLSMEHTVHETKRIYHTHTLHTHSQHVMRCCLASTSFLLHFLDRWVGKPRQPEI